MWLCPSYCLVGLFLCASMQVSFFSGIQHSPVDGCSAVSWDFGVLAGEDECTSFYSVILTAAATAKLPQSYLTLCNPIDGSPPGSSIPGILQARTLEWVAISFSNAWKWKVKVKSLSHVRLFSTPWTAAYQAPLSMGFSRQEYWSGLPLPSPSILTTRGEIY